MSHLSPNFRSVMLLSNHSSSSLDGMEIPTRRSSIRTEGSRKTASCHKAKPLPPAPTLRVPSPRSSRASSIASSRRPSFASSRTHSTASSIYTEDVPPAPQYLAFRKDTLLPCAWYESDAIEGRSSTTLEVPDALLSGPKSPKDRRSQPELQKPGKLQKGPPESLFTEWKPPKYRDFDDDNDSITAPAVGDVLAEPSREARQMAEQHADDYMSVLARASMLPSDDYESYNEGYNSLPSPMSARVTDVVDETLVPLPLRKSTALDSSTPSHFSDSSGYMALKEEYTDSFKSRAKKAFHSHKFSQDKAKKTHPDSHTSSITSDAAGRGQIMSMTPSERASIQQGIIDMYDSLTSLYDPLKQHATTPEMKPRIDIVQDFQSPAIAMTSCQGQEGKAWEAADSRPQSPLTLSAHESWFPASPIMSTPKKSHFSQSSQESVCRESHTSLSLIEKKKKKMKTYSLPQTEARPKEDRSVSGKFKKAVGLEGKKNKQTEDEKRREDMKKKIVIVETIEQGPFLIQK